MQKLIRTTLLATLSVGLFCGPAVAGLPVGPFPLGDPGLAEHEHRSSQELVPGVTVHTVDSGGGSSASPWLISAGIARNKQEQIGRAHV